MSRSFLGLAVVGVGIVVGACRPTSAGDEDGSDASSTGTQDETDTGDTGPNQAPPAPALVSPPDQSEDVEIQTTLCWESVADPDGDPVRYRVFVDDVELSEGKLGDEGFEGPCTGPLDLLFDRQYAWEVIAYDADEPTAQSEPSERWSFHTKWDGDSKVLFQDEFEDAFDWEVGGDASSGAWVWGEPEYTEHKPSLNTSVMSQPGGCPLGQSCAFTGHNPEGVDEEEDVSGGSTTLTSPAFDLSDTESVAVRMSRFFYKSEDEETGSSLRVELLVPDDEEPEGYQSYVLDHLELGDEIIDTNKWTAVSLPGCGVPPVEGVRLRLTATDVGDGIVEAAIDSVEVTGFKNSDVCADGVGKLCDPDDPNACGDDLLCCAQGVLQTGFHRCEEPVRSLDYANPPNDPDDPNNGPLGCDAPDIVVREQGALVYVEDIFVEQNSCTVYEGCVGGTGWRTVLRFDAQTANIGSSDLTMGIPVNHPDLYHYSPCHMHYHFDGYAVYELVDDGDQVVATGHKQAYCMVDWRSWAWPWLMGKEVGGDEGFYNCYNQGLSRGWEDVYAADLDCQWVDVTDVAPGDYTLRVEVNPTLPNSDDRRLIERDYDNNVLEMPVSVP
jgi:hypothetical protein